MLLLFGIFNFLWFLSFYMFESGSLVAHTDLEFASAPRMNSRSSSLGLPSVDWD